MSSFPIAEMIVKWGLAQGCIGIQERDSSPFLNFYQEAKRSNACFTICGIEAIIRCVCTWRSKSLEVGSEKITLN